MGIRIQKHLGYALTGVTPEDERVNWKFAEGRCHSGHAYLRWLDERYGPGEGKPFPSMDWLTIRHEANWLEHDVAECASYDYETSDHGRASVIVVRPLCHPDWSRTDDSIDYSADQLRDDMGESRHELLRTGIFPFDGQLMDAETGERLPREALTWRQVTRSLESRPGDKDKRQDAIDAMELFTRDLLPQYPGYQAAAARVVPCVPQEVRDVCEFLGLFTSDETWKQLRPVLATWWGLPRRPRGRRRAGRSPAGPAPGGHEAAFRSRCRVRRPQAMAMASSSLRPCPSVQALMSRSSSCHEILAVLSRDAFQAAYPGSSGARRYR
jgi:hypothetical protein